MRFLRQNTAVLITVGPFYDKTDGVTIETGLTITNERITLTADTDDNAAPTNILDNVTGATSGTSNDLNYITGNDAGMMQLELSAANTNRVGRMLLSVTDAANHVPVFHEFFVLPQAIYDWLTGVIVPLPANVTTWLGTAAATPTVAGVPEVDLTHVGGSTTNVSALATNVDAILTDTGTTLDGRIPAALVGGRMDASVGAMAANVITAAATAADFTTEVTTGLATAAAVTAVDGKIDTIDTNVDAILVDTNELQTDWVDGGRLDLLIDSIVSKVDAVDDFLDTEIADILVDTGTTLDDFIDTEIAAIKAKTDSLTFTVANQVDANVQAINDTALTGDGGGTPWGPV